MPTDTQNEPHWPGSGSQAPLPEPAAASADTIRAPPLWRAEEEWWGGEGGGQGNKVASCSYPGSLGGASGPFPNRAFVGSAQGAPGSILGTESSVGGPLRESPRGEVLEGSREPSPRASAVCTGAE